MIFYFLNSIWHFLIAIEYLFVTVLCGLGIIFCVMNFTFLLAMVYKLKFISKRKYFSFDPEFKWIKPTTIYLPFELYLTVCNFFIVRISIFGHGFELKIKWYDVIKNITEDHKKVPQEDDRKIKNI